MNRSLLICLALFGATLPSGCLFAKKNAKPKEDPAIAAGVEASFRQHWVDKRSNELKATGLTAVAAQAQAEQEFNARYSFTSAAGK
jgi:hypothetical protein